jgi:hypothetical protein
VDWLTFVSLIVKAVAWPITLVLILLFFRRSVGELIPRLRTIRIGSVEVSAAREYDSDVRESLGANAEVQRRLQAAARHGDEPNRN